MPNLEKLNMLGTLVLSLILTCILPSSATIVLAKPPPPPSEPKHSPNILFIILDDVGIDQLRSFNPFSPQAVPVPNIDAIVNNGVKFTNLWTMPECSPSRACFFTGRYPLRTGVTAALLPEDLPRAQVSPYEATIPRVLAQAGSRVLAHAGYESALIGKYHLGGPENNPAGMAAPAKLGWDFFNGNLAASPPAIDTTVGGQYLNDDVEVRYPCGFPTGPQTGACWFQDSNGTPYCDDNSGAGYTGNQCVTMGGIPALDLNGNFAPSCAEANPSPPDFTKQNAYYVWQRVTIDGKEIDTSPARKYATTAQTDDAIDWINKVNAGGKRAPWMCTVSYNSIHTPYQQPPSDLFPTGFIWPVDLPIDCSSIVAQKVISDLMLIALDKEIGRLLVGTGLAREGPLGDLIYEPALTDTMIVVVGDNGTFFPSVNAPYNHLRSKGTPYQTGVATPLAISGPLVSEPGRVVNSMVNSVDLFELFGEIAGVDVRKEVPASHILDSRPMLAYLTNPAQSSIRPFNFTQLGDGLKPPSVKLYPCVLPIGTNLACTDILFTSQEICEGEGGQWFGPTDQVPDPPYPTCCDVRENVIPDLIIAPIQVWAVRNNRYKLVKSDREACDLALKGEFEFYDLKPTPENPIGLDETDLLVAGDPVNLDPEQLANYQQLQTELAHLLASEPGCPGDGNLDKRVDQRDRGGVKKFTGQPSVFDLNNDGATNALDLNIVNENFGDTCLPQP